LIIVKKSEISVSAIETLLTNQYLIIIYCLICTNSTALNCLANINNWD